jgi:formylglycine-generating enzyme required for sulfatase activity
MLGNVWEWCSDDLRKYEAEAVVDPVGPTDGAKRALRGGSWLNYARSVRAACRSAYGRGYRYDYVGCTEFGRELQQAR